MSSSAFFTLFNYFDTLIAVLTYSHPVFWAQSPPFYHLRYILYWVRSKVNYGTQSWPRAGRNGKVWASDLVRPGHCHLTAVWNWTHYQTLWASVFSSVKWVWEALSWGLIEFVECLWSAWPIAWPVLRLSRMPVLTLINLSPGVSTHYTEM